MIRFWHKLENLLIRVSQENSFFIFKNKINYDNKEKGTTVTHTQILIIWEVY
jgi:hypothetical protein